MIIKSKMKIMHPCVNFIHILCVPSAPIFLRQKITKPNVTREKLLNLLSYKKSERKMLMKLTPPLQHYSLMANKSCLSCLLLS